MFATHQNAPSGQRTLGPPPPYRPPPPLTEEERTKRRFYCFYCNDLSFSQEDLQRHMVQRHFTFKCSICVYGSMQKEDVLRHMKEMHPPSTDERLVKLVRTQAGVPNTFPHPVPRRALNQPAAPASTSASSVSPFVQIITSCSETNGIRTQHVEANMMPKDQVNLLGPYNGQMDGPLTIALPDEVNIQAGSFVELIEVNTVNGKKELKLRLVPQQATGSTLRPMGRETTPQRATTVATGALSTNSSTNRRRTAANNRVTLDNSGKPPAATRLSSTTTTTTAREAPTVRLPITTTIQSPVAAFTTTPTREMQTLNRLPLTTTIQSTAASFSATPIRERPTVNRPTLAAPVKSAAATRLTSTTPPTREMPTLNSLLFSTTGQSAAFSTAPTREMPTINRPNVTVSVTSAAAASTRKNQGWNRPPNGLPLATTTGSAAAAFSTTLTREKPGERGKCTVTRPALKRGNRSPHHVPRTSTDTRNQLTHSEMAVKDNLPERNSKGNAIQVSEIKEETVNGEDITSRPSSLPVISCVFSLSRQWENDQSCPQPFLKALEKMAMVPSPPTAKTSLIYEKQTLGMATPHEENIRTSNTNNKLAKDLSMVQKINQKAGHQKENGKHCKEFKTQILNSSFVKETTCLKSTQEQSLSLSVVKSTAPVSTNSLAMSVQNEASPSGSSHIDPGGFLRSVPQCGINKPDISLGSLSYITIPLKRIKLDEKMHKSTSNEKQHITLNLRREEKMGKKVGKKLWKVSGSQRRPRSLDFPGNFVCLKADQHVKQPGPNQPVVVLNLAKPQALRRKAGTGSLTDTVDSEVIPTCHILKMKLNKVMGQKYEVSGFTVRFCVQER